MFDHGIERGVGAQILHTKNGTATMFGVWGMGGGDQCWAGIRKWVRASQGFRLVLGMEIGGYQTMVERQPGV